MKFLLSLRKALSLLDGRDFRKWNGSERREDGEKGGAGPFG